MASQLKVIPGGNSFLGGPVSFWKFFSLQKKKKIILEVARTLSLWLSLKSVEIPINEF